MVDLHYSHPLLAALYDLDSGWSEDRDFHLALADRPAMRILDLGCGTGLLCDAYAAGGHLVTGVDPAAAMLDQARRKPNGSLVTWVEAAAEDFRSDQRFDLAIMTGHAFQVLLEPEAVLAVFRMVRAHLQPGGRFVFESRNPALDWPVRWNGDVERVWNGQPLHQSRHCGGWQGNRIGFATRYRVAGQSLTSHSILLFLTAAEITQSLADAGMSVGPVLGGWQGQPFDPEMSEEMIFVAHPSP